MGLVKPARILLVDDDADIVESLQNVIEGSIDGAEVRTAFDGPTALEALKDNGWAAVVTDYRMPGMNGAELAARVRQAKPNVPILMITAFDDESIDREASRSGVSVVLRKPFDVDQFVDAVANLLRR